MEIRADDALKSDAAAVIVRPRVTVLANKEPRKAVTESTIVDIVSGDAYFLSAMQYQLEHVVEVPYRHFSDFDECRRAIHAVRPQILIIEWNMRDMAAIDFLIRVSEDLAWGEMVVYFVCDHVLTESEHCQMLSLGTDCAFYKGPGSESIPGFPALIRAVQMELAKA